MAEHGGINEHVPVPQLLWRGCDSMMVIDEHRRVLAMNPALERLTGRRAIDVIGQEECGALVACRNAHGCRLLDRARECPGLKALRQSRTVKYTEYLIRNAKGRTIPVSASYTPIRSRPRGPKWALAVLRDMTVSKRRERRLARAAMTDPLTHLANRTKFTRVCALELARALRYDRPLAIAILDVDGFKAYNDTYGHPAGDELLKTLAKLLQTGHRSLELAARYGGDEFVLLLPETTPEGAMALAERLRRTIADMPFTPARPSGGKESWVPITVSVGVATFREDGRLLDELLAVADRRLYDAKRQGRNTIVGPPRVRERLGTARRRHGAPAVAPA